MDYVSQENGAGIYGEQSEIAPVSRVSFESRLGGLYVIRIPGGPCKIGRTRDLAARLAKMQTHHPYNLELACWLPGRGHEELAWHHCFDQSRIRGEWFEWTKEIARAVELAIAGEDWTVVAEPPIELLAELAGRESALAPMEHGRNLYRALLKRWATERGAGGRTTRLPPRSNTPATPKSPGPVPKHRRLPLPTPPEPRP